MNPISIDQYISGAASICREERQYALYLNNVLMNIKGKIEGEKPLSKEDYEILTACALPKDVRIEHVFYEATFMRDIFHYLQDKEDKDEQKAENFNNALLSFIMEKCCLPTDTLNVEKLLEKIIVYSAFGKQKKKCLAEINLGVMGEDMTMQLCLCPVENADALDSVVNIMVDGIVVK